VVELLVWDDDDSWNIRRSTFLFFSFLFFSEFGSIWLMLVHFPHGVGGGQFWVSFALLGVSWSGVVGGGELCYFCLLF